jgi:hypothetical protein
VKLYKLLSVYGLLLAVIVTPACSKSSNDNDTQQPAITLTLPASNQVYANGSTVTIQGSATDNALHEVRIKIANGSTVLFSKTNVAHNMTRYDILENWTISVTATINALVTVEAEDLGGNIVSKTVNVTINQ